MKIAEEKFLSATTKKTKYYLFNLQNDEVVRGLSRVSDAKVCKFGLLLRRARVRADIINGNADAARENQGVEGRSINPKGFHQICKTRSNRPRQIRVCHSREHHVVSAISGATMQPVRYATWNRFVFGTVVHKSTGTYVYSFSIALMTRQLRSVQSEHISFNCGATKQLL